MTNILKYILLLSSNLTSINSNEEITLNMIELKEKQIKNHESINDVLIMILAFDCVSRLDIKNSFFQITNFDSMFDFLKCLLNFSELLFSVFELMLLYNLKKGEYYNYNLLFLINSCVGEVLFNIMFRREIFSDKNYVENIMQPTLYIFFYTFTLIGVNYFTKTIQTKKIALKKMKINLKSYKSKKIILSNKYLI